jgi:hypothetical protein
LGGGNYSTGTNSEIKITKMIPISITKIVSMSAKKAIKHLTSLQNRSLIAGIEFFTLSTNQFQFSASSIAA